MPRSLYSFICGVHGVTRGFSDSVQCAQKHTGKCKPVGWDLNIDDLSPVPGSAIANPEPTR